MNFDDFVNSLSEEEKQKLMQGLMEASKKPPVKIKARDLPSRGKIMRQRLHQIAELVTPELIARWKQDSEKTLFFEREVLDVLDIPITLTNNPKMYDLYQNHFEDIIEIIEEQI